MDGIWRAHRKWNERRLTGVVSPRADIAHPPEADGQVLPLAAA